MSKKILVVEDAAPIRELVALNLRLTDCQVDEAESAEEALKLLTSTPAAVLGKEGVKGCVREGADADLLVLGDGLAIDGLFAKGKTALWKGEIKMKGRFE